MQRILLTSLLMTSMLIIPGCSKSVLTVQGALEQVVDGLHAASRKSLVEGKFVDEDGKEKRFRYGLMPSEVEVVLGVKVTKNAQLGVTAIKGVSPLTLGVSSDSNSQITVKYRNIIFAHKDELIHAKTKCAIDLIRFGVEKGDCPSFPNTSGATPINSIKFMYSTHFS